MELVNFSFFLVVVLCSFLLPLLLDRVNFSYFIFSVFRFHWLWINPSISVLTVFLSGLNMSTIHAALSRPLSTSSVILVWLCSFSLLVLLALFIFLVEINWSLLFFYGLFLCQQIKFQIRLNKKNCHHLALSGFWCIKMVIYLCLTHKLLALIQWTNFAAFVSVKLLCCFIEFCSP